MTIRRRLQVSFLAILLLFGVNQLMNVGVARERARSLGALDRALKRQVIIASIHQDLGNLHKQVTLLSQTEVVPGGGGPTAENRDQFNQTLSGIAGQIHELENLAEPAHRELINELSRTFGKLAEAWKGFYQYFGMEQGAAVALQIQAEPLSAQILNDLVPRLRENEKQRVQDAEAQSDAVMRRTRWLSWILFVLSAGVAISVAYSLSRHILRRCGDLSFGASLIGTGQLEHRIPVAGADELGHLARSFNEMAENLLAARNQLTLANAELDRRHQEVERQRQVADSLLRNILPGQVADELAANGVVEPKYFEDVTILFTDFVGFTLVAEKLPAEDLVNLLHNYFTVFDQIASRYGLEKLKTIGDSYMCVGGLPVRTLSHPVDTVLAAFEMVQAVAEWDHPLRLAVRVGIHTGPVIAGIVGIHKFAFDVWGDTVNFASRLESCSAANRINISHRTFARVKDFFEFEHRGKVLTKDKKEVDMYFARGLLADLMGDTSELPPPAFLRRYHVYFQRDPSAFPAFLVQPAHTQPGQRRQSAVPPVLWREATG